jgi:hypothetical protein
MVIGDLPAPEAATADSPDPDKTTEDKSAEKSATGPAVKTADKTVTSKLKSEGKKNPAKGGDA